MTDAQRQAIDESAAWYLAHGAKEIRGHACKRPGERVFVLDGAIIFLGPQGELAMRHFPVRRDTTEERPT